MRPLLPGYSLVSMPRHAFAKFYRDVVSHLRLTNYGHKPYSLRRGGAAPLYGTTGDIKAAALRGRWACFGWQASTSQMRWQNFKKRSLQGKSLSWLHLIGVGRLTFGRASMGEVGVAARLLCKVRLMLTNAAFSCLRIADGSPATVALDVCHPRAQYYSPGSRMPNNYSGASA